MAKDWKGNSASTFKSLAATSHSEEERETNDYYATEPKAVRLLLDLEDFDGPIWECACGEGYMSEEIKRLGYDVYSSDIIDRRYGEVQDFLEIDNLETDKNIITNPPYSMVDAFIKKGYGILEKDKKLALFLPIRYLEGKSRKSIYKTIPPKAVYISSSRLICAINGDFERVKSSAVAYAWFVWQKGWKEKTILDWFN